MRPEPMLWALLPLAFAVHAEPPSESSVRTLIEVSRADSGIEASMQGLESRLIGSVEALLAQHRLPAERQERIRIEALRHLGRVRAEIERAWRDFQPQQVKIYQETFSQQEVDGLIEFYRSPAGQALLAKSPRLSQVAEERWSRHMLQRVDPVIDGLTEAVRKAAR